MDCREVNELLVAYLDGEVTPSERKMMEAHLTGCASCQEEMARLAAAQLRLFRSLKEVAADAAPSPQAWSRLQARLAKPAPRKLWPQRLAPGVWHTLTTKGGEILMKHKLAMATVATLALVICVVAFVPAVRAQVGEAIARWFYIRAPGGEVEMGWSAIGMDFTPLQPTYLPAGLQSAGGGISLVEIGGDSESGKFKLTYHSDEQFVAITQTKAQADKPLPAGREVTVNGQKGMLVTGLEGTFEFGPRIPEDATVKVVGTPPAKPFPSHGSIAYTDGKRLVWYAGDVKVEMLSNLPEEEMLKIAESLAPAEAGEGEPPFQPLLDLPSGGEKEVIETEGGYIIIQEGPVESNP